MREAGVSFLEDIQKLNERLCVYVMDSDSTVYEVQINSNYWIDFKQAIKGIFDNGMLDLIDLNPQGFYLMSNLNETVFISPLLLIHIQLDPSLEKLYRAK